VLSEDSHREGHEDHEDTKDGRSSLICFVTFAPLSQEPAPVQEKATMESETISGKGNGEV